MTKAGKFVSVMVAAVLILALVGVMMPVLPARAQTGNLTWAPMYMDGTGDNIIYTDCAEAVSFAWEDGSGTWFAANSYEGDSQDFNITFENLDTTSHDLYFGYDGLNDLDAGDVAISPSPVTIAGGGTATVTFTLDLSTYPDMPSDDWYDYYFVSIDIGYDDPGMSTTSLDFYDYVIPTSVPALPAVELCEVDFANQSYEVYTMRLYDVETDGMDGFDSGYFYDTYWQDEFWDYSYVYDFYDETGGDSEWGDWDSSEMDILTDGSVRITDHGTLTDGLSDVGWDKTWLFTHDDWWVKTTDTFTNNGSVAESFSMSYYIDCNAGDSTGIMVPGVYDSWTLTEPLGSFEIAAADMTEPVIYLCDMDGTQSSTDPGTFGALIFDPLPEYNSDGVDPTASAGTAIRFTENDYFFYYYRFDLDPAESVTIDPYYILTAAGNSADAEQYLMDAVEDILDPAAPPPPPAPRSVGGEVYPVDKVSILMPWAALALVVIAGGVWLVRRRVHQ